MAFLHRVGSFFPSARDESDERDRSPRRSAPPKPVKVIELKKEKNTPLQMHAPAKAGESYAEPDVREAVTKLRREEELRPVWFLPGVDDHKGMFDQASKAERTYKPSLPTAVKSERFDELAREVEEAQRAEAEANAPREAIREARRTRRHDPVVKAARAAQRNEAEAAVAAEAVMAAAEETARKQQAKATAMAQRRAAKAAALQEVQRSNADAAAATATRRVTRSQTAAARARAAARAEVEQAMSRPPPSRPASARKAAEEPPAANRPPPPSPPVKANVTVEYAPKGMRAPTREEIKRLHQTSMEAYAKAVRRPTTAPSGSASGSGAGPSQALAPVTPPKGKISDAAIPGSPANSLQIFAIQSKFNDAPRELIKIH